MVSILHDVGDVVQPGDVLLEIDPTDYELDFQQNLRAMQLDVARIITPLPPERDFEPDAGFGDPEAHWTSRQLPSVVRAKPDGQERQRPLPAGLQLFERNR